MCRGEARSEYFRLQRSVEGQGRGKQFVGGCTIQPKQMVFSLENREMV